MNGYKINKLVSRNRKAVTLTEVVMASALLIIAIVPILRGLAGSHSASTAIERRTRSLMLAQVKMEDIRARTINNYSSSFKQDDISLDTNFRCDVKDTASGSDLRKITVKVGFDDDSDSKLDNDEVDAELVTLIAKRI